MNSNEKIRQSTRPRSESNSMWMWIVFILFFFGLQALLWTNAIRLARQHPIRPVPVPQSEETATGSPALKKADATQSEPIAKKQNDERNHKRPK